MTQRIAAALAAATFCATIPAANWLIGNVGTVCVPAGPCLVPVAPGIMAPSGVLLIGLALVLRDWLHELAGWRWVLAAIAVGGALSGIVAPGPLVAASVTAFLLSELADFAVYTPLRKRGLAFAIMASGVVGSIIDSALFLIIAFGSVDHITGLVLGKLYASAAVALWFKMRGR